MYTNSIVENNKMLESLATSSKESEVLSPNSVAYNDNSVKKDSSLSADDTPKEETVKLNLDGKAPLNNELEQPNNTPASSVSGPSESAGTSKKSATMPNVGQFLPKIPHQVHCLSCLLDNLASDHGPRANDSKEFSLTEKVGVAPLTLTLNINLNINPVTALGELGNMISKTTSNRNPEQVSPPAAAGQQQASQSSTTRVDNQQPAFTSSSVPDQNPASSTVNSLFSDATATLAQSALNKS